jgi:hypothetical protein
MEHTNSNAPLLSDEAILLQPVSNEENFMIPIEDFSSICSEAIYVIDFQKQCFYYIPNHNLFLCGYTREDAMLSG